MTAANDLAVPAGAADLAERNRLLLGAVQESDAAEGNELRFEKGYRRLLLAPGRYADWRPGSAQPLRTYAVAATATDCVCAGLVAAASDSRAAQPFHFHSGGASPAPCPKSSGDHSRGQRRARRSSQRPACVIIADCRPQSAKPPNWRKTPPSIIVA